MSKELIDELESSLNAKPEAEEKESVQDEKNIVDLYLLGDLVSVRDIINKKVISVVNSEISKKT